MDPRVARLTKREVELLYHVFLGRKTVEIATIEGIAPQTVLNRLQDARGKLGGVDRRRAALIVADAKGWVPGIKPTPLENTLSGPSLVPPSAVVSHEGWRSDQDDLQPEGGVFLKTIAPDGAPDRNGPLPGRRNQHDLLTRVSMLLLRTALLVAATVAFLWVYGKV